MNRALATTLFALLLGGAGFAQGVETKIKMKDLPPAVQQAVKEHSKGATLRGLAKEVENGRTLYEAELRAGGRTRDVTFDAEGKVVSVEQEVPLDSIPVPAREAIQKSVGKGKLLLVESVTEGGVTNYEAHVREGGKERELKVDANGKSVQ